MYRLAKPGILGKRKKSVKSAKANKHHPQSEPQSVQRLLKAHQCTPKSPSSLSTSTSPICPPIPRMSSRIKQKRGGRKHRPSTSDPSPLDVFFAKYYPKFEYDSTESASHEFYRLCDESRWDRDNPERADAHEHFKDALVRQFNEAYGTNENDLGDWQSLCHIVHIQPVPDDLYACREAVRGTHVNLVDLVDTHTTGKAVRVFDSERALSEYTRTNGKFFPRESAYAGGLLRYLLRHILDPAKESPSHRRFRKRR